VADAEPRAKAYTEVLKAVGEGPRCRPFSDRDHPSGEMLKRAHDAFKAGDVEALFGMMTDDCVWHMPGNNMLSGDFVGRDAILQSFGTLQRSVDEYWAWPLDYFGSDHHVVLVAQVKARRGDRTLDVKECLLWRLEGEKLAEVWHMALDETAWDAFFSD
jgi:ketosteroid isomerase-like protein